jgi:hypothetical protein
MIPGWPQRSCRGIAWALAQWSAAAAWTAGRCVCGRARLQAADGDDFLSGPDLECEGAAAAVDDGVGAVIQRLERQIQTRRAEMSSAGSSLGRLELQLCLGKEKAETGVSKVF